MASLARRRRIKAKSKLTETVTQGISLPSGFTLPSTVILTGTLNCALFPKVPPMKLGDYDYSGNYLDCNKSDIVNALCICHLTREVKWVIFKDLIIPEGEVADVEFAVKYFTMLGMDICQEGKSDIEAGVKPCTK